MSLLTGIGAVGQGLNASMGTLTQAARDQRALQSPENQYKQALSQKGIEDLKKISLDDVAKMHPMAPDMIDYAKSKGIILPNQKDITTGEVRDQWKNIITDPKVFLPIVEKGYNRYSEEVKNGETSIAIQTEQLQKLQKDPLGNEEKIKEAEKTLAGYTARTNEAKNNSLQYSSHMDKLKELSSRQDYDKMSAADKVVYQSVSEDNKAKGMRGVNALPTANQLLEKKQEQKKETTDHYTIQNTKDPKDIKSIRLSSGESIPSGYKVIGGQGMTEGMQFNPETLKAPAERFGASGEIPGMGMGKAATEARTKVLNQWASDLKSTATTPQEQLSKQATYKASVSELKRLQSQRGTVMAFATTADKNLNLVSQLSDKVDRTGVPVINRWLLAGKKSLAGDTDVAKFDAAVRTAINEYAKVTSSATGGGVTSDQARKEVESMLNTAQTQEQVTGVIKLLRQEMGNRREGYDTQIKTIQDSISGKGAETQKLPEDSSQPSDRSEIKSKYSKWGIE